MIEAASRIVVFGPDPLLSVVIEERAAGGDEIHLHAAGQGVWVARMAAELGGAPVLCGFVGGETEAVVARASRSRARRAPARSQ
jgi:1-phosphofructokinase